MVNKELSPVQNWLVSNRLTLNVKKCNFIVFKSYKKHLKATLNINLNNQVTQRVDKTKFLGLIIDQHLTWKYHIDYIAKKISKTIGIFCRIRFYINQQLLKMLYV